MRPLREGGLSSADKSIAFLSFGFANNATDDGIVTLLTLDAVIPPGDQLAAEQTLPWLKASLETPNTTLADFLKSVTSHNA